jgi:hypothetical protein
MTAMMIRLGRRLLASALAAALLAAAPLAVAGEADDLQRMIDVARQGGKDLERLDVHQSVRDELTLLNVWLDSAWKLRSEQKYDEVRVVLDRVQAQADMIRQKIAAAQLDYEATEKETELKKLRDEIARTRATLQAAAVQKAALEGHAK